MERTLITGGAGFIGSHLAEALLEKGNHVCVIDDLSTGSITNIEHLKSNAHFEYHIDTIMNVPLMAELIDRCDMMYHLAAAVGVKLVVESPVNTIETNIKGTEIVLELANKKKKKTLIASTSEIYGKSDKVPFREQDDLVLGSTTRPRWSYACSKAIDEFLALAYWKEKQLPIIIVRLFNTVGPRQTGRYGMVIPRFVEQALADQSITVYSDGSQTRSFCHVKDVVRGITGLMEHPDAVGEVFNIGSSEEISISDLANRVKERAGSSSDIAYIPFEEAYDRDFEDLIRRVPDISKIHKLTGFTPSLSIVEIIDSVIDYCRNREH